MNLSRSLSPLLRLLFFTAVVAAPVATHAVDDRSAYTKAVATARIFGFMEILRNSGLPEETVNGPEVTLLVPVDTAFYGLKPADYQALLSPANRELAARWIRAHVVPGRWTLAALAAEPHATLGGTTIQVTAAAGREPARVNGLRVVLADQAGGAGMFHLVDGFLLGP